jgi:predicted nucleic-acid-binding Zn-ribbon protein
MAGRVTRMVASPFGISIGKSEAKIRSRGNTGNGLQDSIKINLKEIVAVVCRETRYSKYPYLLFYLVFYNILIKTECNYRR